MSVAIARRPQDNFASGSGSKLHIDAQTYCSSLFAGTASIVVRGSDKGSHDLYQQDQINITDLPVSTVKLIISIFDDTCKHAMLEVVSFINRSLL